MIIMVVRKNEEKMSNQVGVCSLLNEFYLQLRGDEICFNGGFEFIQIQGLGTDSRNSLMAVNEYFIKPTENKQ